MRSHNFVQRLLAAAYSRCCHVSWAAQSAIAIVNRAKLMWCYRQVTVTVVRAALSSERVARPALRGIRFWHVLGMHAIPEPGHMPEEVASSRKKERMHAEAEFDASVGIDMIIANACAVLLLLIFTDDTCGGC